MQHANIKLSKSESALVADKDVILTKNMIIEKVCNLFGILSGGFRAVTLLRNEQLPQEALSISPKISKGERYLGLPYVVLDYPRYYTHQDVLAIRCFFWWGNFFSISLHLSGAFLTLYGPAVNNWINVNGNKGWYISTGTDAWQHHFEASNYQPLEDGAHKTGALMPLEGRDFIKLAKKLPVGQWDDAKDFFTEGFMELLRLLEN